MFLIHNTLGEDAKIFDVDEEPTPAGLYERIQQNPDKAEEEGFYTKALRAFLEIKKENPSVVENLAKCPTRVKVAKKYSENELLVFLKKGRMYINTIKYDTDKKEQIQPTVFEEVFDRIACEENERKLSLSDVFWKWYEKVKKFKEHHLGPAGEQSLEQRALNNLNTLIRTPWEDLLPHLDFLRMLREDIMDYGTLSDYTLRRIANLEYPDNAKRKRTVEEIASLKKELGDSYLQIEKDRQKDLSKDIIIAIENQAR